MKANETSIPSDALIAGLDTKGSPLYICRYTINSVLIAGKLDKQLGCVLTSDGNEVIVKNKTFEVLVTKNSVWVPRHGTDPIPESALVVGTKTNGSNTYVGRTMIDSTMVIGKIDYFFKYSLSGNEKTYYHNHEVLVCQ